MAAIWMDGRLVPEEDATVSVLAHTLHYGVGVFEGVRSYAWEAGGGAIFRLEDHLRRLEDSARTCGFELPCPRETLAAACVEVLEAAGMRDGYLRPIAFHGAGGLNVGAAPPVTVAIAALPWGAYLGEDGMTRGISVTVAAARRAGVAAALHKAKLCGQYVQSVLANRRAVADGYDEALLLDEQGYVAEGTGENLFCVRDGILVTPPLDAPILPGITRDSVLVLAEEIHDELGLLAIVERRITRDELLIADEVFLTGTAAEVTPVRAIDGVTIGDGRPGPVTRGLQTSYLALVRGERPAPALWWTRFGAAVR